MRHSLKNSPNKITPQISGQHYHKELENININRLEVLHAQLFTYTLRVITGNQISE